MGRFSSPLTTSCLESELTICRQIHQDHQIPSAYYCFANSRATCFAQDLGQGQRRDAFSLRQSYSKGAYWEVVRGLHWASRSSGVQSSRYAAWVRYYSKEYGRGQAVGTNKCRSFQAGRLWRVLTRWRYIVRIESAYVMVVIILRSPKGLTQYFESRARNLNVRRAEIIDYRG